MLCLLYHCGNRYNVPALPRKPICLPCFSYLPSFSRNPKSNIQILYPFTSSSLLNLPHNPAALCAPRTPLHSPDPRHIPIQLLLVLLRGFEAERFLGFVREGLGQDGVADQAGAEEDAGAGWEGAVFSLFVRGVYGRGRRKGGRAKGKRGEGERTYDQREDIVVVVFLSDCDGGGRTRELKSLLGRMAKFAENDSGCEGVEGVASLHASEVVVRCKAGM